MSQINPSFLTLFCRAFYHSNRTNTKLGPSSSGYSYRFSFCRERKQHWSFRSPLCTEHTSHYHLTIKAVPFDTKWSPLISVGDLSAITFKMSYQCSKQTYNYFSANSLTRKWASGALASACFDCSYSASGSRETQVHPLAQSTAWLAFTFPVTELSYTEVVTQTGNQS